MKFSNNKFSSVADPIQLVHFLSQCLSVCVCLRMFLQDIMVPKHGSRLNLIFLHCQLTGFYGSSKWILHQCCPFGREWRYRTPPGRGSGWGGGIWSVPLLLAFIGRIFPEFHVLKAQCYLFHPLIILCTVADLGSSKSDQGYSANCHG